MSRFFKKSEHIDELREKELRRFLDREKVTGKVEIGRVRDFYNALSSLVADEDIQLQDTIDYDYFNCQKQEDFQKIDELKGIENSYLHSINKDMITQDRLLKGAVALAYQFEKMMSSGKTANPSTTNINLRNLFEYSEDNTNEGDPIPFGELLEMDFDFLHYLALLSKKKAFAKTEGKLVRSENGPFSKYTMMEHINEIGNMDLFQAAMPDFHKKVATKELDVRSRYEKKIKSQNLIILIDDSGSMNDPEKMNMLKAALTLKIKEHSPSNNIYIGTFETRIFGYMKIEKGMSFSDVNKHIHLDKGGTDVNGCIKETIRQVKERKLIGYNRARLPLSESHFEILVINDGEDSVDATYHPDIKLHALCLKQSNPALKNICHRSGGTYFHIKGK